MKNVNVEKVSEFVKTLTKAKPLTLVLKYGDEPWAMVPLEGPYLFAIIAAARQHGPQPLVGKLKEIALVHRQAMEAYFREMAEAKEKGRAPEDTF